MLWSLFVVFCAAGIVVNAQPKVDVKFFGEALCPFCRQFVGGAANKTLESDAIMAITTFDYIPWGNAYYNIQECPGTPGTYDRNVRMCWLTKCNSANPPADCYNGTVTCQHGAPECFGNAVEKCVKDAVADIKKFMEFTYCYEFKGSATAADLRRCAPLFGLDATKIASCATSQTNIDEEAKATVKFAPDHTGVPWVTINGKGGEAPDDLINAICKAYTGPKPSVCPRAKMSF